MDRSGFSAPAAVYERMSPRGYAAVTKGLADSSPVSLGGRLPTSASVGVQGQREEGNGMKRLPLGQGHWANSSGLRKKAVDHILGKVPSAVERSKKEESVWISTTRNLSWAIWEISRRLAFAHAQNEHLALQSATHADEHGAALRLPVPHRQSELQVHLSIIKLDPPARPGAGATPPESPKEGGKKKGPSEMWIRPRDVLSSALDTIQLNSIEQRDHVLARNRAGMSEEVLFFGRIFGENVLADVVFTSTVS